MPRRASGFRRPARPTKAIASSARLQKAASKLLGALASGNPHRSETASEAVRDRLRRRYGR